jgi:hypothetical protein
MTTEVTFLIVELVVSLIFSLIMGFATASVRESKGYGRSWFWLGFFFGLIPLIVACAIPASQYSEFYDPGELNRSIASNAPAEPERSPLADDDYVEKVVADGGWQCACGRGNPAYVSTCSCGMSKRQNDPAGSDYAVVAAKREEKQQTLASEFRKYKMMLDSQVISQEEYETKIKELSRR